MNPLTQPKNVTILPVLIALMLACFALSPVAQAACQEGCLTNENTVLGEDALLNNTTGIGNTVMGFNALFSNTTGNFNTASGWAALMSNTTGFNNTANGADALSDNTTGGGNTAIGTSALSRNTTGLNNTANGGSALLINTTGTNNTASGWGALSENQTGIGNAALGVEAAKSNNGNFNTASGYQALLGNSGGSFNTANGYHALQGNATGQRNIGLGFEAGKNLITGSDNIDIGNAGFAGDSGKIRIGEVGKHTATFIAGISGVAVPDGVGVIVGNNGKLGTVVSSERYKEKIKPMDKTSEAILSLKPVTFHYKHELDPQGIPQFGLVAEDVEKVNPDLVARDADGKPYTVRYEAVNAMLLNEFLKEHRRNEQQRKDFEAALAQQQKRIDTLTASLEKVSTQLELSKAAQQTVSNMYSTPSTLKQ